MSSEEEGPIPALDVIYQREKIRLDSLESALAESQRQLDVQELEVRDQRLVVSNLRNAIRETRQAIGLMNSREPRYE